MRVDGATGSASKVAQKPAETSKPASTQTTNKNTGVHSQKDNYTASSSNKSFNSLLGAKPANSTTVQNTNTAAPAGTAQTPDTYLVANTELRCRTSPAGAAMESPFPQGTTLTPTLNPDGSMHTEKAVLDGTEYTWVEVSGTNKAGQQQTGWVAMELTTQVSAASIEAVQNAQDTHICQFDAEKLVNKYNPATDAGTPMDGTNANCGPTSLAIALEQQGLTLPMPPDANGQTPLPTNDGEQIQAARYASYGGLNGAKDGVDDAHPGYFSEVENSSYTDTSQPSVIPVGDKFQTTTGLNMRSTPGGDVVEQLNAGATLTPVRNPDGSLHTQSGEVDGTNYTWMEVTNDATGKTGWVAMNTMEGLARGALAATNAAGQPPEVKNVTPNAETIKAELDRGATVVVSGNFMEPAYDQNGQIKRDGNGDIVYQEKSLLHNDNGNVWTRGGGATAHLVTVSGTVPDGNGGYNFVVNDPALRQPVVVTPAQLEKFMEGNASALSIYNPAKNQPANPTPEPVDPNPPQPENPTPVTPTPISPTPVTPTPVNPTPPVVEPTPPNPQPSNPSPIEQITNFFKSIIDFFKGLF